MIATRKWPLERCPGTIYSMHGIIICKMLSLMKLTQSCGVISETPASGTHTFLWTNFWVERKVSALRSEGSTSGISMIKRTQRHRVTLNTISLRRPEWNCTIPQGRHPRPVGAAPLQPIEISDTRSDSSEDDVDESGNYKAPRPTTDPNPLANAQVVYTYLPPRDNTNQQ